MTSIFGQQQSSETRALRSIDQSKYPDTNRDLVKTLQRHGGQIDYMAKYMTIMQQGIDAANSNVIQQIQDLVNDFVVLLGGGQLLSTVVELGDLKYILPALGALFGFDGPFPVNLANAAMHFIFGFVIPQQQFTDAILDIITSWGTFLGIDKKYFEQIRKFFDAITDLFGGLDVFLKSITDFLGGKIDEVVAALGHWGPFGKVLGEILRLFGTIDLSGFPNIIDLILGVFAPFVDSITDVLNLVNGILRMFGASIDGDTTALQNWWKIFELIDWNNPITDTADAITQWFTKALQPILNLLTGNAIIPPNLIPNIGIGSLGFFSFNMLMNPGFNTSPTIVPGSNWSWNNKDGRSTPLGCAQGVAFPGTDMVLMSSDVEVAKGQKLNASAYVKYTGLTFAGGVNPVELRLYAYDKDGAEIRSARTVLARCAGAGPTNGNWTEQLTASYVVPDNVAKVCIGLGISPNIGAGTVMFDDLFLAKNGLLDIAFTEGLPAMLNSIWAGLLDNVANVQELLDALGGKLGSTIADVVNWVKQIADFITNLAKLWTPGAVYSGLQAGIDGALEAIKGILGMSTTASAAAARAEIGVEKMKAELAGGAGDEFDYPLAASLPNPPWVVKYAGSATSTWGPDGRGVLVFKPSGVGNRDVVYRRTDRPITADKGTVTVVLSKPPHADGFPFLVNSWAAVCFHMGADGSHLRWVVHKSRAQLESVSSAGTATPVGGAINIPPVQQNDVLKVQWDDVAGSTTLTLNAVQAATGRYTKIPGQYVGLAAGVSPYAWLTGHPAPEFFGIAWN